MEKAKKTILTVLIALTFALLFAIPAFAAEAPTVTAAGAAAMDFETGEFYYGKNLDTTRPIASMTKVMGVYLVFEAIEKGELTMDTPITASSYAAKVSANPKYSGHEGLVAGEQYTVHDLLKVILTCSANGSMVALAEHIGGSEPAFVAMMNAKAQEMGISAHFGDCCGLVSTGSAVTPRAMALLARNLIRDYPDVLWYTSLKYAGFNGKTFSTTNSLLKNDSVPGIDGLKTGTTSAAGPCFTATASQDGRRIIAVVMKADSSSARYSEGKALLEYGFATRAEREVQWAQAEKMQWEISYEPQKVLPLQTVSLTASVSNIDEGISIPCSEEWFVNGAAVSGSAKDMTLTSNTTRTLNYTPAMGEKEIDVTYQLRFPGGDLYTAEKTVPVADPPKETYTVTWLDENGVLLEEDSGIRYGTQPSYDGEEPVKAETEDYLYTFAGWDKSLTPVLGNVTYTAQYKMIRKGTAKVTFKVKNGTWNDGTIADKVVTVDTLNGVGTLQSIQIPLGMKPLEGYRNGAWDAVPTSAEGGITGNMTYTYGFQAIPHTEVCPAKNFKDVSQTGWYHEAVDYALTHGMMNGTGATKFEPNTPVSRGMLVTILYRLAGSPSLGSDEQGAVHFNDVAWNAWYTDAVNWAAVNQVVGGYGDGRFGPNDPITREQFAVILYRYAQMIDGMPTGSGSSWGLSMYVDANQISDWAWEGLQWTNNTGLIAGKTGTTIAPKASATRAEAATILMRYQGL